MAIVPLCVCHAQRIEVYFSKSVDVALCESLGVPPECMPDGWNVRLDSLLATYIDSAEYSVDMCVYNWDNEALAYLSPAIRNAVDRGVKFRLITDNGFSDTMVIDSLSAWGIAQIDDTFGYGNSREMHCKFFVIDGRDGIATNDIAIISSSNLTSRNLVGDANNTVITDCHELAQSLETQFNIYWGSAGDAPNPDSNTFRSGFPDIIQHIFFYDDATLELYFSPQYGEYEDSILKRISWQNEEICFCINRFTRNEEYVDDSLRQLNARGMDIRGVFGVRDNVYWDMIAANADSDTIFNWSPSLEGKVFPDSITTGVIHSKYLVTDIHHQDSNPFVLTGSMNWSQYGFRENNECVLIIHSHEVALKFFAEFATRYYEAGGHLDAIYERPIKPKPKINIFPNPSSDKLFAIPSLPMDIYDIRGRLVGRFIPPIELYPFPPGRYFIRCNDLKTTITIMR